MNEVNLLYMMANQAGMYSPHLLGLGHGKDRGTRSFQSTLTNKEKDKKNKARKLSLKQRKQNRK